MRSYETVLVLDSQLDDDPIDQEITGIEGLIKSHSGEIVGTERWGSRKISYEIKDRQQGYYTLIRYNAEKEVLEDLDRSCKLNENVLRHMTIRVKKHSDAAASPDDTSEN